MDKKDFYYELPENLIAQTPAEQRDGSRLMYLDKQTGDIFHKQFKDIVNILQKGDCIVINDSKVIPARLISDSSVEILLHENIKGDTWTAMVKPGKKAKIGNDLIFSNGRLIAEVKDTTKEGLRIVLLKYNGDFEQILMDIGEMPLPHYIKQKSDTARYQTVYAEHKGSIAAPTAGLHFTNEILYNLKKNGIDIARVTLHVGIGTFKPVKVNDITKHNMHSEYYKIEQETADIINNTKFAGGRVIAIGTTSCRTLESNINEYGIIQAGSGKTDIFIYPGFKFRAINGLLTNFHLPESTLIMLVSAFAGRENILTAYKKAVTEQYRFFSYGDAMIIL